MKTLTTLICSKLQAKHLVIPQENEEGKNGLV